MVVWVTRPMTLTNKALTRTTNGEDKDLNGHENGNLTFTIPHQHLKAASSFFEKAIESQERIITFTGNSGAMFLLFVKLRFARKLLDRNGVSYIDRVILASALLDPGREKVTYIQSLSTRNSCGSLSLSVSKMFLSYVGVLWIT